MVEGFDLGKERAGGEGGGGGGEVEEKEWKRRRRGGAARPEECEEAGRRRRWQYKPSHASFRCPWPGELGNSFWVLVNHHFNVSNSPTQVPQR